MERCSYFISNKALFGSYPCQDTVKTLEAYGVRYFIDLTFHDEKKITPYKTKFNYINYPIKDQWIPSDTDSFKDLVIDICFLITRLKENEKIYIHCKGGHGRSGTVVACILSLYYNFSSEKALQLTKEYHSNRIEMKDKWRKIGAPQTYTQKQFVKQFVNFARVYVTDENLYIDANNLISVSTN